jgi:hypothetical protein
MLNYTRSAILAASAAVAFALIWIAADVELTDAGHLNGLFYTGAKAELPAEISGSTYRVRDETGYDGEFYYLIAHDPLNRRGFLAYVDTPRYRWRRIGLPGLAHLLAFGNDAWVDSVYVALQLAFVFLGAYWLALYAQRNHRHVAWGLAFLLIPAVAVSLDRMTVDLPLAALCVALLLYAARGELEGGPRWSAYAALAAAPLFRETGIILILAWCVYWLVHRKIRSALFGAACSLPALGWWLYVAANTTPDQTGFFATFPFHGLITWTVHALSGPVAAYGPRANAALELLALAGIWLAFALTVSIAVKGRHPAGGWDLPEITAIAFAAFASLLENQQVWASAYGAGRTLSPLLIALAAIAVRDRRLTFALPVLLIAPRIALQFAAEIKVALLARL